MKRKSNKIVQRKRDAGPQAWIGSAGMPTWQRVLLVLYSWFII